MGLVDPVKETKVAVEAEVGEGTTVKGVDEGVATVVAATVLLPPLKILSLQTYRKISMLIAPSAFKTKHGEPLRLYKISNPSPL